MTVSMAILMFYLLFASVKCAIEAGHQGGAVNQAMVLSVLITVGCESLDMDSLKRVCELMRGFSVCVQQSPGARPVAYVHQFYPISAPFADVHQRPQHVGVSKV